MAGIAFILATFLVSIANGATIKDLPNFNITQIEPRVVIERSSNQSNEIEPRSDPLVCNGATVEGLEDISSADPFVFKPTVLGCTANILVRPNTAVHVDVEEYDHNSANDIAYYWKLTEGGSSYYLFGGSGSSFTISTIPISYILEIRFRGSDEGAIDGFEVHVYSSEDEPETTTSTTTTSTTPSTSASSSTAASTTPSTSASSSTAASTSPPSSGSYCDKCGLTLDNRIVGGIDAEQNEFPWQVGLVKRGRSYIFCGGTLISSEYVLTAAHCLDGSRLDVILGSHSRNTADRGQQTVQVERIISHEAYNSRTMVNDIAVLKLATPVSMTRAMNVACLPMQKIVNAGDSVTATGWGTTSSGGSVPAILQEVTVPALSTSQCRRSYGGVTDNQVCAGLSEGGKDSCQGDSGGPLIVRDSTESRGFVVGITSYGIGCARPNYPGVYTRVSAYLDWISDNTAGTTLCSRQF